MLALSAVQRQAAASRSAKPWMSEQHGFTGGFPNVRSTRLSTLAQVLICIGQVPVVAEVQVKKRRLRETKSAREVLGAICLYSTKDQEVVVYIICFEIGGEKYKCLVGIYRIFIRRKMRRF
jgi:hypothetical protein